MQLEIGRILDALPTMLWTALPDGSTAFVNRRWSDYTGSGLNDDDGREWHFAVCPDDLPDLLKRWQFVLASGEPGEMKARLRRFDGRYRWHLIQCSPVCDESKRISLWCGVGVDIEDHRRSAEFMRRQKLDFQLIVDSIPVPVAVTTPSGEVEGLNKSTLGYFGKSFEELKGWKTSDAVHPDDLEQTIAAQMKAHQQGVSYDIESRHRRHDGTYRWHNVRGFPLRDPRGRIVRWCHLLIDIDDRKQAERALHESELEARLIVETIPGGIEVLAPTGKVELVNEHVARYFGKTAEELKRSGFTELIHPEDLQIVHTATLRATTTGLPYEAEHRFLGADGTYRWFQVRGLPFAMLVGAWCAGMPCTPTLTTRSVLRRRSSRVSGISNSHSTRFRPWPGRLIETAVPNILTGTTWIMSAFRPSRQRDGVGQTRFTRTTRPGWLPRGGPFWLPAGRERPKSDCGVMMGRTGGCCFAPAHCATRKGILLNGMA